MRSESLRALLQLQARLRVALERGWDVAVRRRICRSLRGVRRLVPELPHLPEIDEAMLKEVSALAQQYSKRERVAAKARWKDQMRSNPDAVRNFIKQRAEAILAWEASSESQKFPVSGHRPAFEVERLSKDWMAKWTARPCGDADAVESILHEVPGLQPLAINFAFEASSLRAAAASMRTRAPGPDCWSADLLLHMPQRWWQCAAKLWSVVMDTQRIPRIWLAGKTCLIPKPNGKSRPITILPIMWRAGAKLVNAQLAFWCAAWKQGFDVGGVPASSVEDALQQLQWEISKRCRAAVQQDVAGYFDSLDHTLTARVLHHLGAPECFVRLFNAACVGSRRLFSYSGALSAEWAAQLAGYPRVAP